MKITITFDFAPGQDRAEYIARVEGMVCPEGTRLSQYGFNQFELLHPSGRNDDWTPAQAGQFVRDFYNEGFTDTVKLAA